MLSWVLDWMTGFIGTSITVITAHSQSSAKPFFLDHQGLSVLCFPFYNSLQITFIVPYKPLAWTMHRKRIENTVSMEKCLHRPAMDILCC
jgi:hypothetical protein